DARVYTLTPGSVAFLERINAWQGVPAERITPVYDMQVFGDGGTSRLDFSAYEAGLGELGATVESGQLSHALWRGLERQRNLSVICPAVPREILRVEGGVELRLDLGRSVKARLVVGADGADSWVRAAAGVEALTQSYDPLGVGANLACERPHRHGAFPWFRGDGVLAFLPLPERRVSIVWSTPRSHAGELLALPAAAFCARVAEASQGALGRLDLLAPPAAFPLSRLVTRRLAHARVALIGDSAHVVHPL